MKQLVLLALVCLFAGCAVKEEYKEKPDRKKRDKDYVAYEEVVKEKYEVEPEVVEKEKVYERGHRHDHFKAEVEIK